MGKPIRVLFVEDSEDDSILLLREIRNGGYDPVYERVDTPTAMKESLQMRKWDAIVCDYVMPKFSMPEALKILQKSGLDLPFILVSGTVGEDVAVEAMKAGAHDYIMKDRLARLVPAIDREIREARKRQQIRQADNAIQALVKSTVGTTGQDFFDNVVKSICELLGAEYAYVGQIVDGDTIKALSVLFDEKFECDCTYKISGTLCETVLKEGYKVYTNEEDKKFVRACKIFAEKKVEGYVGISLRDKSGKPIGILWAASRNKLELPLRTAEVMDIIAAKASSEIERKEMLEDLRSAKEYSECIIQSSLDMIIATDKGRDIVTFNRAAEEAFGYAKEEIMGKHIGMLYVDPSQGVQVHNFTMNNSEFKGEVLNKRKNGDTFISHLSSSALRDENGNFIGAMGVSRDITEQKKIEDQIKASLKEKEVLLKEIHHRVKNNLQIISSLLNIQSEYINDEQALSVFTESQNRVKSMALVHEELYHSNDLARIDFAEYVRSLVNNLFRSYGINSDVIIPRLEITDVLLEVTVAIPCGLLINELVTNSLKYAFPFLSVQDKPENSKGEIKISMHRVSDLESQNTESKSEMIELIVSDNGIGIPEEIDFRDTKTLGLELVNTLTNQINGTIELDNKNGAEFKIRFEK